MSSSCSVTSPAEASGLSPIGRSFPPNATTEGSPTNNPESERADDARLAAFPPDPSSSVSDVVVICSEEYTVDSPQVEAYVRSFADDGEITALGLARRISPISSRSVSRNGYSTRPSLDRRPRRRSPAHQSPELPAKVESEELPGRAIAPLVADPNVLAKSGRVFTTPELAHEYGFADVDGRQQSAFWDEHWAGTWGA